MLVLEGPQGIGKSTALRALAGEFFSDVPLDASSKDTLLYIHGPWIVEWSELAGLGKREAEAVKSFLSRRIDRYRPPYGKAAIEIPRRCVFVGSTNEYQYLNDASGNRRFWPIRVGELDIGAIERDRAPIWAEAKHLYHTGSPWWLDPDGEGLAQEQQSLRHEADPWQNAIETFLTESWAGETWISSEDIYGAIGLDKERFDPNKARRVARCMRLAGWVPDRKRVGGTLLRGFLKLSLCQ
jgi:predicted P-loop ATPase